MPQGQIRFETVPIGSIEPYGQNPRRHSRRQIEKIADNMKANGVTNPPLVDEVGILIGGHGRLEAAKLLGLETLPVIRITGLSDAQKRALRISDNRLGELSRWSHELLELEIAALLETDIELSLTGYDGIEIDALLTTDPVAVDEEPMIAPPPAQPVSRIGDLWALGKHRVLCGDARSAEAYAVVLGGKLADQVIADLPFNVPIVGHVSGLGKLSHQEFAMASGEMSPEAFAAFMTEVLALARDHSRDGSIHYYFMDHRSIADLIGVGRSIFRQFKNLLVWAKSNAGMGSLYRSQHELVAVFKHGKAPHVNNVQLGRLGRNRSNLLQYPGAAGFSKLRDDLENHPSPKPIKLIADLIRDTSNVDDLVLDNFGGAGTIVLAAEQVGRRAAMIEIEPRYVDVTLARFQKATGIEPVLMPLGTPLSQVRQARIPSMEPSDV